MPNLTDNAIHIVEVECSCPDPDMCATNNLVADRNTGWKEAWRIRAELEHLYSFAALLVND